MTAAALRAIAEAQMTDVAKLVKKLRNTTLYCEDVWTKAA